MFYVKEQLNAAMTVSIEITDENVYTHCPRCGDEVKVDIADLLRDNDCDLYGTAVYCAVCSHHIREGGRDHGRE